MHESPCETLKECKTNTDERLTSIESKLDDLLEISEVWRDGKGFVNGFKVISKIAIFISLTGAALTTIYQAIKHIGD